MTEEEIVNTCKKYDIKNYTVNPDMSVDVDGDVNLWAKNLTKLPLKFGKVTGEFDCSSNNLTGLKDCPNYVGGDFGCSHTKITSLHGLPINFYIGGDFWCTNTKIKDVNEFGRLFFGYIVGKVYTGNFYLQDFLNKNKNPPKKDLPRLLSELRKITL